MALSRGRARDDADPLSLVTPDERRATRAEVRLAVAGREYPRSTALGGALAIVLNLITLVAIQLFAPQDQDIGAYAAYLVVGPVLLVASWLMSRRGVPARARRWVFAATGCAVALAIVLNLRVGDTGITFSILLLLVCIFGGTALAWAPYAVFCAATFAMAVVAVAVWPIDSAVNWLSLLCGGFAVGAILLSVRLGTIDELADATAATRALADHDELTGLLNRHGLLRKGPAVWEAAQRTGASGYVVFVDVEGLKLANDRFGHAFGDDVIRAAADAVRGAAGSADLVARWGGDEIVVVGAGSLADAQSLGERVATAPRRARGDGWTGGLSLGFAVGTTATQSLPEVIALADADMYRRRRA